MRPWTTRSRRQRAQERRRREDHARRTMIVRAEHAQAQNLARAWEQGYQQRHQDEAGMTATPNPYGLARPRVTGLLGLVADPGATADVRIAAALTTALRREDYGSPKGELERALAVVLAQMGFDPHALPHVDGICEHEEIYL